MENQHHGFHKDLRRRQMLNETIMALCLLFNDHTLSQLDKTVNQPSAKFCHQKTWQIKPLGISSSMQ